MTPKFLFNKLTKRFLKSEDGGIDEVFAMFFGLIFIMFFVIPPITQFMVIYLQAQEVEHLTGMAANRACSLLPSQLENDNGSRQGAMGSLLKASEVMTVMQKVVDDTFQEEAKNLSMYKTDSGANNWEIKIYDIYGQDITNGAAGFPGGFIGASPSTHMCPAPPVYMSNAPANWCLSATPMELKRIFSDKDGTAGTQDQDSQNTDGVPASFRQELFQRGRDVAGAQRDERIKKSLEGQLHRCVVTAEKKVQSVFYFAGLGPIFHDFKKILPTVIKKQANAPFRHENTQRTNVIAYKHNGLLGKYNNYEMADPTLAGDANYAMDADGNIVDLHEVKVDSDITKHVDTHASIPSDFFNERENIDAPAKDLYGTGP